MRSLFTIYFFLLLISTEVFSQETNIVALRNGAWMLEVPPSYENLESREHHKKYSPGSLLDETNAPWCSKNSSFPLTFVIELVEEYEISSLEFNNIVENQPGIATKKVIVSFSASPTLDNYIQAGKFELKEGQIQNFKVAGKARRIKVTITENYGNKDFVELTEFKAFGKPLKQLAENVNIDGTWESNWQKTKLIQSGNTFTGSYKYSNVSGTITNGQIHRNAIEFDYEEYDPKEGKRVGTSLLYLNEEGNRLSGVWQNTNLKNDFGLWILDKKQPIPIIYKTQKPEGNDSLKKDYFNNKKVILDESIVLKNVLFIRGKAELLPEAFEELDGLIQTLKNDLSLEIELSGHTDNSGSPNLNIELSEERVITVKKYLIASGINKKRITGQGYGGKKPIASNAHETTRRLNRRVEFKLSKK